MSSYYLNPHLFFLLNSGALQCWNYKSHQQYEIGLEDFNILFKVLQGQYIDINPTILDELELAGLISPTPYFQDLWHWDLLSKIFHQGTQNIGDSKPVSEEAWTQAAIIHSLSVSLNQKDLFYTHPGYQIPLHPNASLFENAPFLETVLKRRTSRQFSGEPVDLSVLSTLLYYSFGAVHTEDLMTSLHVGLRKTSPSAGGLHPTEVFVVVFNVNGLKAGIYHYNVQNNALGCLATRLTQEELKCAFYDQPFMMGNAFGFFLASRLDLVWKKYPHSRSYRDALIELGHVSQTVLLTATALKMKNWLTGLFHDRTISNYLDINGVSFAPLFYICFGPEDD